MRQLRKILCVVMTMAFVFVLACPASTAYSATKSIKEGKWVNVSSTSNYYKVAVRSEGYITLTANNKKGTAYFDLLNSKKEYFSEPCTVFAAKGNIKSIKVPVSKGTYYIRLRDEVTLGGKAYVKYKFTPIKQKTNYCMAKAITLKPKKFTKIYQSPDYSFDRYFKIKLTSSKKVTIYSASEVEVFDTEGNRITCSTYDTDSGLRKYRTEKLKAGTYYLAVQFMYYDIPGIFKVKWL